MGAERGGVCHRSSSGSLSSGHACDAGGGRKAGQVRMVGSSWGCSPLCWSMSADVSADDVAAGAEAAERFLPVGEARHKRPGPPGSRYAQRLFPLATTPSRSSSGGLAAGSRCAFLPPGHIARRIPAGPPPAPHAVGLLQPIPGSGAREEARRCAAGSTGLGETWREKKRSGSAPEPQSALREMYQDEASWTHPFCKRPGCAGAHPGEAGAQPTSVRPGRAMTRDATRGPYLAPCVAVASERSGVGSGTRGMMMCRASREPTGLSVTGRWSLRHSSITCGVGTVESASARKV